MLFFITDCYSYFSRLNSRSVSILSLILYIGCYNNFHFDTPSEFSNSFLLHQCNIRPNEQADKAPSYVPDRCMAICML